jgi:ubiquitin-like modifier-activating enzyme ATG7
MIVSLLQIAITAVLGYDNYLVMRHGAGPGVIDEVIAETGNLSTKDVHGCQRLSCCFCKDAASLVHVWCIEISFCGNVLLSFYFIILLCSFVTYNVILLQSIPNVKYDQQATTLPGLTSIASGKAVELFARMLHHLDE